jgi:pimeloyl-ACP methyl ester carboxylesterase
MPAQGVQPTMHDKRAASEVRMLSEDEVSASPPSKWLLLAEGRAWMEYAAFLISMPWLRRLPHGDGQPVMVVPGFGGSDASTLPMRRLLRRLGYAVHGWELGRNTGMNTRIKHALARSVESLHERHGQTVSLIGWSLGGVYVREMARYAPEHVRQVITLGSPINGHPRANNVDALFRLVNRGKNINLDWEAFQERRVPPPVPCTAIYSKSDGVVAWHCSREESCAHTESVGVLSSHFGLAVNPLVLLIIADRLAQPEGNWQPYRSQAWQKRLVHAEHPVTTT